MEQSAGFIIIDKKSKKVLAGHPTGRAFDYAFSFDIPKGHIEAGESPLEAAQRELKEETGIVLSDDQEIYEIGHVHYNSSKGLHLFSTELDVDLDSLHCDSTFVDSYGNVRKEIDKFILTDRCDQFFKNLRRHVIGELQRRYKLRLVQFKIDGKLIDNYLPTERAARICQLIQHAYERNKVNEAASYQFVHDGQMYEMTNKDIIDAIHSGHDLVPNYWMSLISKESLYEPFNFVEWMTTANIKPECA